MTHEDEVGDERLLETAMVGPKGIRAVTTMSLNKYDFDIVSDALVAKNPQNRVAPTTITPGGRRQGRLTTYYYVL